MPARQGNIQVYSSIFKIFLKNIQRICIVRPVCARHNGQDRPPVSLRTPSMTTLERTLDKLSLIKLGRSPLKYINCKFYIILERKVCLLKESLGFHKYLGQVFLHRTNSWCQIPIKYCHVDVLEAFVLWRLV
jgi:hypothetical protein